LLSRRAARKHLVASRHPKYFLRLRNAGSVSPGSGRPVRHIRLRPGVSPQTLQTPPHDGRPVLRIHHDEPTRRVLRPPAPGEALPPPIGYGPRLGSVRLDSHQLATRAARRTLRPAPTAARPPTPLPGFAGYRRGIASRHLAGDGAETALPSSQDDHPQVQRPIRQRVPQRPHLDQERFPWPSP
jgi:hypothetical protein